MNMADCILQSLHSRKARVVLRGQLDAFGSSSQVSVALLALVHRGSLVRLKRGVYATPATVAKCGATALLGGGSAKQGPTLTPTARWVAALARETRVDGHPTYADRFAASATRLAGDRVKPDATDDLLVALRRAGTITDSELLMHVMAHHRAQAPLIRSAISRHAVDCGTRNEKEGPDLINAAEYAFLSIRLVMFLAAHQRHLPRALLYR